MHILLLSCFKATQLIEKDKEGGLSVIKKMQLSVHKSMCKACALYEVQSDILDQAIQKISDRTINEQSVDDLKKSILTKIEER
ncbi:hypothetical protein E9993_02525 [Labilibacter sediminis]|nr:hypothetical protein E9993_02525 [Labilibacter sediminis]